MNSFSVPRGDPSKPAILSSGQWSRVSTGDFIDGKNFFLGFDQDGKAQGYMDDRHMLLVAGSRAGKGTSAIIPNLLSYRGSCLVIDPKGENARITKAWRESIGQKCYVLDPFGKTPFPTTSFNPIEAIARLPKDEQEDDAALLADALIMNDSNGNDSHWILSAKNLITGLILYAVDTKKNLIDIHEILSQINLVNDQQGSQKEQQETGKKVSSVLQELRSHKRDAVRRSINSLINKDHREASSVISTAIEQLGFLDSPAMGKVVKNHDFELSALKEEPTTIYLCLPAMRMGTHARWLRIFITLAMTEFERQGDIKPELPVLMVLDEMHALGHMKVIETSAALIAGYGVKIWSIFQDIAQLKSIYKDRWQTFIGNAGLMQFFGNTDYDTCEYISKILGNTTITKENASYNIEKETNKDRADGKIKTSISEQIITTSLLTPDEVTYFFAAVRMNQIIKVPHLFPLRLERGEYYRHSIFSNRATEL